MQRIKKITAIILSVLTLSSVCVFGSSFSAGAKGTGAGLAEWALMPITADGHMFTAVQPPERLTVQVLSIHMPAAKDAVIHSLKQLPKQVR